MPRRPVHLGLDYGTSASKLILRDLGANGAPIAKPILFGGEFRIPSSLLVAGDRIFLGRSPAPGDIGVWLHSVKMFAAAETDPTAYALQAPRLPTGLRFLDLATITVWWLLGLGRQEAVRQLRIPERDVALSFSLGVPMHFHADPKLRETFMRVAAGADFLLKQVGPLARPEIEVGQAIELSLKVQREMPRASMTESLVKSEAQAAIWFTYQSPKAPQGPYVKVDVGAGTTNVSVFRLHGDVAARTKDQLNVFGTGSSATGMDNVDAAIASALNDQRLAAYRGLENRWLADPRVTQNGQRVINAIFEVLKQGWAASGAKIVGLPHERAAWRSNCRMLLVGGGSLVNAIRERIQEHPDDSTCRVRILELDVPRDLQMGGSKSFLPFMLVAYGLSDPDLDIQELRVPAEISDAPLANSRTQGTACACRGTNEQCAQCLGKGYLQNESSFRSLSVPEAGRSGLPSPAELAQRSAARARKLAASRDREPVVDSRKQAAAPARVATRHPMATCPRCAAPVREDRVEEHARKRCKASREGQSAAPPLPTRQRARSRPTPIAKPPTASTRPPAIRVVDVAKRSKTPNATPMRQGKPTALPPLVQILEAARLPNSPDPRSRELNALRAAGLRVEVIDKRSQGGRLWVVGGQELSSIMVTLFVQGLKFTFVAAGATETGNRPSWLLRS